VILNRTLAGLFFALILTGCQSQPTRSPEILNLEQKAAAGDAAAQFSLAAAYDFGHGVERSGPLAFKWYTKAAEQGHAEAQNSLGSAYQAEKKYSQALFWYQKAADQNHPLATNNLAYLYDLGLGIPQDRKKGHALYLKSANLGWAEAMFNLANMYGAGQLGSVDYYQAYIWCARSERFAEPGWRELQSKSQECIQYVTEMLTPEQINQAKIEAQQWEPNQQPKPTPYRRGLP